MLVLIVSFHSGPIPSQIQKIMMDFEKESATMDMKEEMMSDAVDDAMDAGKCKCTIFHPSR